MKEKREIIEETINFTLTKLPENEGWLIKTENNPYVMVGRLKKLDAVKIAFKRYLERLSEIENKKDINTMTTTKEKETKKYE